MKITVEKGNKKMDQNKLKSIIAYQTDWHEDSERFTSLMTSILDLEKAGPASNLTEKEEKIVTDILLKLDELIEALGRK